MYARIATFEGDPEKVDQAIDGVRTQLANPPAGLESARFLMLVDRASGKGYGITLYDSEEAMRRGDEALNAMRGGGGGTRTGVELYEVPVHNLA